MNCCSKQQLTEKRNMFKFEVVVAQLVERSLPTPEVRGAFRIQSSANFYIGHLIVYLLSTVLKRQNKGKEAGNVPFLICLSLLLLISANRPQVVATAAAGWRTTRQNSSNKSKESQEITYVPTSVLKGTAVPQESTEVEVRIPVHAN